MPESRMNTGFAVLGIFKNTNKNTSKIFACPVFRISLSAGLYQYIIRSPNEKFLLLSTIWQFWTFVDFV
jgi:hypothetical protein